MGDIQDLENDSNNIEQVNAFISVLQIILTYKIYQNMLQNLIS